MPCSASGIGLTVPMLSLSFVMMKLFRPYRAPVLVHYASSKPVSIGTEMAELRINPSQVAVGRLVPTSSGLYDYIEPRHNGGCHLTYLVRGWSSKS